MSAAYSHTQASSSVPLSSSNSPSAQSPAKSRFLASISSPSTSSANTRAQRSAQPLMDDKGAISLLEDTEQDLFDQVQDYCCERTSTEGFSDITKQYIAAHKRLISRYCSRFGQQAAIPNSSDRDRAFHAQLQRHIEDFTWWLKGYSYTPASRFESFCFKLCLAVPAESNMFDAMRKRGVDLHDAYITDTSGESSPTFAVDREMQALAPPIIERILSARVMGLTREEEKSAIEAALSRKRKRASEQVDEYRV